jgi:hypothetical protein
MTHRGQWPPPNGSKRRRHSPQNPNVLPPLTVRHSLANQTPAASFILRRIFDTPGPVSSTAPEGLHT